MRSWSTAHSGDANRVGYWREAICEAIFELEFASSDGGIQAELCQHDFGVVKVSDVSISSAHQVTRSRQAVARDRTPRFNLNYIRKGTWLVSHYGREVELHSGDLILLDNRQPYSVTAQEGTTHVAAHLPVDWLRCWLPSPEEAVARPIRTGDPWHATLTTTLNEALHIYPDEAEMRAMCSQQIGGALALGLGPLAVRPNSNARHIFLRIQTAIRERYCEHALDATAIAACVGISQRYLHKILAQQQTSYVHELYEVRLRHARAMLESRRFVDLSVSEIGWRCGFCDPSHFSRRFKARFGIAPGAFRNRDLLH